MISTPKRIRWVYFNFGKGANNNTLLANVIQISKLENIPVTSPKEKHNTKVDAKKNTKATI